MESESKYLNSLYTIRTTDLYEAAYYLSEGIVPQKTECRYLNKTLICDFYFDAREVEDRQVRFFSEDLKVNLLLFRRCYTEAANYAKIVMVTRTGAYIYLSVFLYVVEPFKYRSIVLKRIF